MMASLADAFEVPWALRNVSVKVARAVLANVIVDGEYFVERESKVRPSGFLRG
jgi:hypothetical protein